jgi:hypothetical protein
MVIAIFHRIVRFGQRQILKRQAPLRRIQKPDSDSPSRKRRAVHHNPSMQKSHSAISQHNLQIERKAIGKFGLYTAPTMLALLKSGRAHASVPSGPVGSQ